jgi:cytochrome c-type biogenesis protein CcmF
MIAEFGLAALWLAAAFALLQAFAGIGHWRGFSPALASLTRPVAVVQGLLCLIAFGCLIWLFALLTFPFCWSLRTAISTSRMIFKLAEAGAIMKDRCCSG